MTVLTDKGTQILSKAQGVYTAVIVSGRVAVTACMAVTAVMLALQASQAQVARTETEHHQLPASCAELGLNPSGAFPDVHGGSCLGQAPYLIEIDNNGARIVCRVTSQHSCRDESSQVVCIRTLDCGGQREVDTSCDLRVN